MTGNYENIVEVPLSNQEVETFRSVNLIQETDSGTLEFTPAGLQAIKAMSQIAQAAVSPVR